MRAKHKKSNKSSNKSNQLKLSDEQQLVCDQILAGNSVVVDSCIGSGKSTLIAEICNRYHEQNTRSKLLYLTYNHKLMEDAIKKIHVPNTTVLNFHTFANRVIRQVTGRTVPPDQQLTQFIKDKRCSNYIKNTFDLICVDEFQDIDNEIADFLYCIKQNNPAATWAFVGDMEQKIYPASLDVYKGCIMKIIPDFIPLKLTQSFRVSADYGKQLSFLWNKDIVGINNKCKQMTVGNLQEAYEILDKFRPQDVLILGLRNSISEFANLLEKQNPTKYNKKTVWVNIGTENTAGKTYKDPLILTTFDSCKGMERPVCVVLDWTDECFQYRVTRAGMDRTRLRNIFLVAASRGKRYNIFVQSFNRHLVTKDTLYADYREAKLPVQCPTTMFRYKDNADLRECLKYVQTEEIKQADHSLIQAKLSDYNIDLTPVLSEYQKLMFFKKHDSKKEDKLCKVLLKEKPVYKWVNKWLTDERNSTPERTALGYIALYTEVLRYCKTATDRYMSDMDKEVLRNRLSSRLSADTESIQAQCEYHGGFDCMGLIDYIDKNNIPWTLKFTEELSIEHMLQAAMYSVMYGSEYAYLWNTYNNRLLRITVKDKEKFIDMVYDCVTYHRYGR